MFYISVSNGLLKDGHRKRMGSAVWEFMWMLDKVTRVDEDGTGWVLHGKPIKLQTIANELGTHIQTVSLNLIRLDKEGYIEKQVVRDGMVLKVKKARKKFGRKVEPVSEKDGTSNQENTEPQSRKDGTSNQENTEPQSRKDGTSNQENTEPQSRKDGTSSRKHGTSYKVLDTAVDITSLSHSEREIITQDLKRLFPGMTSLPEAVPSGRAFLFLHKVRSGEIRKEQIYSPVAYMVKMADEDITELLRKYRVNWAREAAASPQGGER